MATEVLSHRDYKRVAQSNLEMIRADLWDVEFDESSDWPKAVYFPGMEYFKTRLKSLSITMANGTTKIEKEIFVSKIHQNAGRDVQTGTVTFNFIDREDQAITNMLNDWLNQIGDPNTGFGRHKTELTFNCTIVFYDTLLVPKRKIVCDCGILDSAEIPETPGEKGADMSECAMTISFQQMVRELV